MEKISCMQPIFDHITFIKIVHISFQRLVIWFWITRVTQLLVHGNIETINAYFVYFLQALMQFFLKIEKKEKTILQSFELFLPSMSFFSFLFWKLIFVSVSANSLPTIFFFGWFYKQKIYLFEKKPQTIFPFSKKKEIMCSWYLRV
jgi:hypothetical protein